VHHCIPAVRLIVIAALVAAALAVPAQHIASPPGPMSVTLVYVAADDCPPCRIWQREAGAAFRASPEFSRLTYREVRSPTLRDVLADAHWPEDLRAYRAQLGPAAGVPLWLVIADQDVVERGYGASQWRSAVLPKLRSILR
jgi:hypothetical protein